jgi:hypothetical protein
MLGNHWKVYFHSRKISTDREFSEKISLLKVENFQEEKRNKQTNHRLGGNGWTEFSADVRRTYT